MLKRLLDRPITVTMALLVAVVLGVVAMRLLPVGLIPDVDIPYITVQVTAPELSARELDRTVLRPLRSQLIQMQDMEDIRSEARDGSGTISLSFTQGSDIGYLFIEANEKVDRSMSSLGNIARPRVLKSTASDIPAFYLNLTLKDGGGDRFRELSSFALEVASRRIEQLESVAMVDLSGCTQDEILIVPDGEKLLAAGISRSDFEQAVTAANLQLGSLSIRDGEYRYSVKFRSFAGSASDIADIYLNCNGRLLQIKDIATVTEQAQKRTGFVRSDGKDAVTMAVIKQNDARMADLHRGMDDLLKQFAADYPEVEFTLTRDQTTLLEFSVNNLLMNIILGVLLACIVIFLFMKDFRSPALVALTMPAALIISMLVFYAAGISINIISLSGLILGVGMMTDNTVVLIDNITARWQRGEGLRDAVLRGTSEVAGPMLSSLLTTVAVFLPLIFLSGTAGAMFHDQAIAITTVLICSYFVTITVIPVYYHWWYRKDREFRPSRMLRRFSTDGIISAYERAEAWLFRRPWVGWTVFGVSAAGLAVCLAFMPRERLPEMTYSDALLSVDWNAQLTAERNGERVAELEALMREGGATQVTGMVGEQQFVLSHSGESTQSQAVVYFKCPDAKSLRKLEGILLTYISDTYPYAVAGIGPSGNIFDAVFAERQATLEARLRPVSVPELQTDRVQASVASISKAFPAAGVPDVVTKRDLLYVADPELMALYGISYGELLGVLRNALNGNRIFSIVSGNNSVPVVIGSGRQEALADILENTSVRKEDREIPVRALMRATYDEDLAQIVAGVEGNYYPVELDIPGNEVPGAMKTIRETLRESGDFEASFAGSWFSNRKMTRELLLVLLVALILLYLILASQFESLLQPFIVLSEVVIDIFFSLLILWACGVSVNIMSLTGLVVISGIVINDSILKIDTINRLRREGMALDHAVMEAGVRRFKAIVMTSLTTILAVLPSMRRGSMGADLQFPLNLVVVTGMVVGTLVSLFFVPMLYREIYRRKERR